MIDNEFPQSSPPIRTNKDTGDKMVQSAIESADRQTHERIKKVWQPIIENDNWINSLPISFQYKSDDKFKEVVSPDQFVSIPLIGGDEIKLSRTNTIWKEGAGSSELVMAVKTTNAEGKPIEIPQFEISKYGGDAFGYEVNDFLGANSYKRDVGQKDPLEGTRHKLVKETNRFLSLFNPQKDIDLQKLPQPTLVQASCLKAFGVTAK